MGLLPKKLHTRLVEREEGNTLRTLPKDIRGIDFSSNDYLGIANNQIVFKKATSILYEKEIVKNGATGSRLLTGNGILFNEVEKLLRELHNADSALIFNSGYDANIGLFSSVPQRDDIILYDEFIHASIRDGIKMSNARSYKYRHNDLKDLLSHILREKGKNTNNDREIYIVTESVFSMDGDSPDLKALSLLCEKFKCNLIVDEAHAIGLFGSNGCGRIQELKLQENIFARIITFSKALGCHGAAILGSADLNKYLINFARSFIYTTGLPPHALATIIAAYQYMTNPEGLRERELLHENIAMFNQEKERLGISSFFIPSSSAIHSCIIKGNNKVKQIAQIIQKNSFDVRPILSPSVPKGEERLRFCLHSFNSKEDICIMLQHLELAIKEI
ncbi:aminotransferase class I/II-fold pyridoxal phosphate-dependent enzyme [Eudoraea sp.]|uniref:aminotransferase class I/II-fold pyridoxal phosphate-dependent enzyme n=2 Tax=Eudoraea sp. TaxID=1979955 RepID=UPI003C71B58D